MKKHKTYSIHMDSLSGLTLVVWEIIYENLATDMIETHLVWWLICGGLASTWKSNLLMQERQIATKKNEISIKRSNITRTNSSTSWQMMNPMGKLQSRFNINTIQSRVGVDTVKPLRYLLKEASKDGFQSTFYRWKPRRIWRALWFRAAYLSFYLQLQTSNSWNLSND